MSVELGPAEPWTNWGRSASSRPAAVARPTTVDEVQQLVRLAADRGMTVKAIGAGHSFTAIGATDGLRLDLSGLRGVRAVEGALVTLAAGTHLWELESLLAPYGLALANMGDIDRQTIAGATSTGTHGTGAAFGGLSTQIRAATIVTGTGEFLRVSATENAELLPAVALGLGALGVVVELTVECVPAFLLNAVERPERLGTVLEEWGDRVAGADHFEFYWFPHTEVALTKTNTRLPVDAPRAPLGRARRWVDDELMANGLFGGTVALGRAVPALVPPINRISARLTGNRGFTDLSTRVFVTDRRVRFREMEYAIPVAEVPDALREIRALIERRGWRISFPVEVRAAAADELILSTAAGRASGYIAVHRSWREDPEEYFRGVEEIMIGHGGRPHWGKLHYRDRASLETVYPRLAEFAAVRDRLDPERRFANPYLNRVLGP
ncbi:D-arabinono-1,4-lactone oxidase [Galbitalea soli]|uniref:FAD-binding protein n=1 Tax=Galbitalea soli TaxID=1268042 RepID=A0A7C9TPK9_9MICO|nr:FAD-binding protein [Galbitalea soli]NYJ31396.1 FAD-linked oxidoreductase [Galbitalea soli]